MDFYFWYDLLYQETEIFGYFRLYLLLLSVSARNYSGNSFWKLDIFASYVSFCCNFVYTGSLYKKAGWKSDGFSERIPFIQYRDFRIVYGCCSVSPAFYRNCTEKKFSCFIYCIAGVSWALCGYGDLPFMLQKLSLCTSGSSESPQKM